MKSILIAILICALSITAAQAAPKGNPPGHAGDYICFAPWFRTSKWCHKYRNKQGK